LFFQKARRPGTVCLLWIALLMATPLSASSTETRTSQSEPPKQRLTQPALDRQIDRVLQNPEFGWRARVESNSASSPKQKSIFERWLASIRRMLASFGNWVSRLLKSLLQPFSLKPPFAQPAAPSAPFFLRLLNALGYLLWAAFTATLILLMIRILKLRRPKGPPPIVPSQKPDLADEEIEANQLPDDEWCALAREKRAAGEFRQAQRALFLAILSYLASHHLITVERWKSNSDYEKELGRKAKRFSELPALFLQSRLGFERCWYGPANVTLEDLESYNSIYERIKHAPT
jgi:hypothetical protein